MKLENPRQAPLNTTMMGVLRGVADYYGLEISDGMIYGASGHAFLINIHEQLCPSGPYVWRRQKAEALVANLGLQIDDLGFFDPNSSSEDRAAIEAKVRGFLHRGIACSLLNLENQLVCGCDDTGFCTAQPWQTAFPPARLSFGSWAEFGKEFHVNFYSIEKCPPVDTREAVIASLAYGLDLWAHPQDHSRPAYGIGPEAYDLWIVAAPEHGGDHGNWWNATVWSECRQYASHYMIELAGLFPEAMMEAIHTSQHYLEISSRLGQVSSKDMPASEKITWLRETKALEAQAAEHLAKLLAAIRAG